MFLRHLLRRHNHPFLTRLTTTATVAVTANSNHTFSLPNLTLNPKSYHSTPPLSFSFPSTAVNVVSESSDEDDPAMNEFLSRFVHSMRSKLTDAYPTCDKHTINSMLVLVVDKLVDHMDNNDGSIENIADGDDFDNEDLVKTMSEVATTVYLEMEKEKKKEKLRKYLQCEEVKTLTRFATEIGVRGDMLREMRFKWAKEEMENAEFYEGLQKLKEEAEAEDEDEGIDDDDDEKAEIEGGVDVEGEGEGEGENDRREGLPKRRGKINYKLYGLDLSGQKWREVAGRLKAVEEVVWPSEAKAITGKCKLLTEKIIGLGIESEESRVSALIKEWMELLQPSRVDWIALLDNIKARDHHAYLKMAERLLDEPTFQPDIRDYAVLIDSHANESRVEDVERFLKKMSENGLTPDVLILTTLLHLYSKANKLDKAKEAYEALKTQGFKPDSEIYNSMMMAYVKAGQPDSAEMLLKEVELRDAKVSEEIYMSLLQAFADRGDVKAAQRIAGLLTFAGYQPTALSCTLLIQASAKVGNAVETEKIFNSMRTLGYKPDDKSTSMLISAYEKNYNLDKALSLLLELEKDGFEPGISTYCVLVDWFGKMQLIDEVEQMLTKISQLGEAPPLKLQVSLCDMYAKAGMEKKALQALGVLERKKDLLEHADFERIILGLLHGGFQNDARRIQKLMEARGFSASDSINIRLMADEQMKGSSVNYRRGMR